MPWSLLVVIGSIPACAGEPVPTWMIMNWGWVYPRVCGGTGRQGLTIRHCPGLSPRVRGNRGRRDT